jgi:putative transcriptional regulator
VHLCAFVAQGLHLSTFLGEMLPFYANEPAPMLRYKLKERIADKEFRERRRVTVQEIAEATGITRNTLSKLLNQHGASVRSENLDRLCAYFNCRIEELVEFFPNEGP